MSGENTALKEMATQKPKLELQTIQRIPANERYGRTRDLFGIWFGMNMTPLTVVTGALATAALGLPLWWALVAIIVGNIIGGVGMALHSAQGPQLGVPQMLQARGQFGTYGASLVAFIAIIMFVGFFASNLVVIAQAFRQAVPVLGINTIIILATITSLIVASFGYRIVRWTTVLSALTVGSLVLLSFIWILFVTGVPAQATSSGEFTMVGFLAMMAVGVVWQLAYAPYVSDYSRYMPEGTGARGAFWGTYAGCVMSTILLMTLGALVGVMSGNSDVMAGLGELIGPIGLVVFLGFAIATAAYNSVNTYCSALCTLTVGETFRPGWRPGLRSRLIATAGLNIAGLVIALLSQTNFLANFYAFVTILLYVLIPWSAINLVDYYLIRKGHYDVEAFFRPGGGQYGRWNFAALAIYLLGVLVQIPFVITGIYTGPLVENLGGIDIAWLVGLVVSGGVYYVVARQRLSKQEPDINEGAQTGEPEHTDSNEEAREQVEKT